MNTNLNRYLIFIVSKYLETPNDYINLMKVCKKYNDIILMFHYNPINEYWLFENIATLIIDDVYNTPKYPDYHPKHYYKIVITKEIQYLSYEYYDLKDLLIPKWCDILQFRNLSYYPNEDEIEENILHIPKNITKILCNEDLQNINYIIFPNTIKELEQSSFYKQSLKYIDLSSTQIIRRRAIRHI